MAALPQRQPTADFKKILVGMSGGVDSSVAAALLLQQGYEVVGGFIKNWSDAKDLWTGECQWRGERRDALRVCARLGIPLMTFNFEDSYRARVLDQMFADYARGLTPNPDVLCNQEIKFGLFFETAKRQGFDGIAMGHYAQTQLDDRGAAHLFKGVDVDKDQSYFLHRIDQRALRQSLFPIGHLTKSEVRSLAKAFGLATAHKPDSQGICFVGKLDFHDFLRQRIPATPGDIVSIDGNVLGRHDGLDAYTIGQRQGLGVSHDRQAWYVAAKDRQKNHLIMVPGRQHPALFSDQARLRDVRWIAEPERLNGLGVEVAVRYRQQPTAAAIHQCDGFLEASFDQPVWAVAPGQSAVIYRGDECLGGGFISETS